MKKLIVVLLSLGFLVIGCATPKQALRTADLATAAITDAERLADVIYPELSEEKGKELADIVVKSIDAVILYRMSVYMWALTDQKPADFKLIKHAMLQLVSHVIDVIEDYKKPKLMGVDYAEEIH